MEVQRSKSSYRIDITLGRRELWGENGVVGGFFLGLQPDLKAESQPAEWTDIEISILL